VVVGLNFLCFPETLSISKSKRIFKILGIDAKTDELESFLVNDEALDLDQSLFLHFAALKIIQMEKANQAFDLIDKDKKGIVVLEDLQRVAQELGEEFSQEELTEMIELADRSGDGLLQSKDFVRIARKIKL
jgi:Ca2+-binding EF-hand superfamily protein